MFLIFVFLLGFGLAVTGGVTLIAYLNFLPIGLGWGDYTDFIITRPECYFFPIGFVLMAIAVYSYTNER